MKKTVGYFFRFLSVFFFIILIFQVFKVLFFDKLENEEVAFKVGYYFGAFLILALFSWLLYKFFKYSGKLIAFKNVTNQVDEIGNDKI